MRLKDMNLNKLLGREAAMQGRWSVTTSNGQVHDVWVGLKSSITRARIIVEVDDSPFAENRKFVIAGEVVKFELGGDVFVVRHTGIGMMGQFCLIQNGRELHETTVTQTAAKPSPAPSVDETWETWIEEVERFSEPLGDEVRVIDNTRSNSGTERKITVSRQWSQSVALDMEKATDIGGDLDVKLPLSFGFGASATRSVKRRYAISEEVTRTYSEEVTIHVQSQTHTTITFSWRQVWQKGVVVGRNNQGLEMRVPFEVKLHPTFDQAQADVKNADS